MAHKSWVISYALSTEPDKKDVIEHLSNRKKIAQIEEYLCELYGEIMLKEMPETEFDATDLKSGLTRKSGTETALEKAPYIVYAELIETDL